MALAVLDGNQSATTLSSVVTGGEHIVAHSVVSLGSNAISNITTAISGSTVCVGNLGLLQSTVATEGLSASGSFIKIGGHTGTSTTGNIVHVSAVGALRVDGSVYTQPVSIASVTIGNTVTIAGTVTANPTGTQTIAGTVTANVFGYDKNLDEFKKIPIQDCQEVVGASDDAIPVLPCNEFGNISSSNPLPISGTVTIGSALPAGTNRIGVVTIGAGTVTIGAGTAQIGSVTASISGTVPISISSVTVGNSVTIGSLPAISGTVTANIGNAVVIQLVGAVQDGDGTTFGVDRDFPVSGAVQIQAGSNQIGSVTANTFAVQGTAVTTSNFTSTTASTVLANFNATREVLTIFNEGAGNLHICAGATCTTIAYQVRLSAGDYYEVPNHQTTITHSAVFATAGTARVTEVS